MQNKAFFYLLSTMILITAFGARADVTISRTRIIYPAEERSTYILLNNKSTQPALVQVWVDLTEEFKNPRTIKTPFIVNPPLVRIEKKSTKSVKIVKISPIFQKKESVFWLNVLELPIESQKSRSGVSLAVRSQIKLFYRPKGLLGSSEQAAKSIIWSVVKSTDKTIIVATNNSGYHVTLVASKINGSQDLISEPSVMIPPMSRKEFAVQTLSSDENNKIYYSWIDDDGNQRDHISKIKFKRI